MEAGYNSHRFGLETHMEEEGIFGHGGPYGSSPYSYNTTPPIKSRSNVRDGSHFLELNAENSLARKLLNLTGALNQGKPISVEDLMSLKIDNEVNLCPLANIILIKYTKIQGENFILFFDRLILKLYSY